MAKLVPTGAPAATFNELVAGRVDVGWAAPPFGIDEIERGEIRVIARRQRCGPAGSIQDQAYSNV